MEYKYYKSTILHLLDKLGLRFGKDTLSLYHALTGRTKYPLAVLLINLALLFQVIYFALVGSVYFMVGNYSTIAFNTILLIVYIFVNLVMKLIFQDIIKCEEIAKDSGTLVYPEIYRKVVNEGLFWGVFSILFISLSLIHFDITIFIDASFAFISLAHYVIRVQDIPPGKTVFEKIKDKIKSRGRVLSPVGVGS